MNRYLLHIPRPTEDSKELRVGQVRLKIHPNPFPDRKDTSDWPERITIEIINEASVCIASDPYGVDHRFLKSYLVDFYEPL